MYSTIVQTWPIDVIQKFVTGTVTVIKNKMQAASSSLRESWQYDTENNVLFLCGKKEQYTTRRGETWSCLAYAVNMILHLFISQ